MREGLAHEAVGPNRRVRRALAALAGLLAVLAVPLAESIAKKGEAELVSRQSKNAGAMAANGDSRGPVISANGRFAAYASVATNLGGPAAAVRNVYVYDRTKKRVSLVSRQSKSAGGQGGDSDSDGPALSTNGRFVAFNTDATNLGGPGGIADKVYVYDRKKKRVVLVSRQSKSAGGDLADGNSLSGGISGDGRYVAFRTPADNLGGPINPVAGNVYVYDRRLKKVSLVSRRSKAKNGKGHNGQIPTGLQISSSGRYVAFPSSATNLVPAAKNVDNCYVYDRKAKVVELVSRRSKSAGGAGANDDCFNPSISANGRYVAINTSATNLGGDNAPGKGKIYVYDRKLDRIQLVSRRSKNGPAADGFSEIGSISANGRFVGFTTAADNLGGPINPAFQQSYVYDRKQGRARLVSRRSKSIGGGAANGSSFHPAPTAEGRLVAFATNATNLGGPVVMAPEQVYVFDLLGPG